MKNIKIPNNILIPDIKNKITQYGNATIRVYGYSMRIFLENGRDKVTLTRPEIDKLQKGDVVLAEIAPQLYVLHRIIRRNGNHLTLMGDGNVQGTEECDVNSVIGIATAFYRKNREKPDLATSKKWQIYSRVWLTLTPIRRWILAFYRHIWLKIFPIKQPYSK